ncbi:hypothetical protein [Nitrosomonas halophila]|jgi:hypothetical protein|uniref:Uncharacterized protein n=1 Tax=Nitrosomonas halophila TaxID=44576 RepID=A0A1H3HHK4_9PROT|nr:hypothetical protein [Nitrosomonas halophila]SDY15033.1 hypothetical protein SAMN05421881_102012 [Nitrosomonas halophila]
MITESDWKKFKKIKEAALEKFCAKVLTDVQEATSQADMSNYAKYIYLFKLIENADKRLSLLFDSHSRSKARMQLMLLRSEGLVAEDDLEGLSDELIQSTGPIESNP